MQTLPERIEEVAGDRCACEVSGTASRLRVSVMIYPTALNHMVLSSSQSYAGHLLSIEGRDRSAARTTLGGEFPTLALSIREVGSSFHHSPRFHRPPCDPGRWAFPSPVLTLTPRRSPSQRARSLSADPHTPPYALVYFHGRSIVRRPYMSGYVSDHGGAEHSTSSSWGVSQDRLGLSPLNKHEIASTRIGKVGRPRIRQVCRNDNTRSTQRLPFSLYVPWLRLRHNTANR
jgi:hypothetical protein